MQHFHSMRVEFLIPVRDDCLTGAWALTFSGIFFHPRTVSGLHRGRNLRGPLKAAGDSHFGLAAAYKTTMKSPSTLPVEKRHRIQGMAP